MGYLQALNLLIRTYKATKGYLPKGLDMLKLKMKARQKVIDSKKVIEFPKDKITNPFKPRPTKTEIMMKQEGIPVTVKGKTTTMTPDGILKMLMGKGKGKDVKIGQAPKTTKRKPTIDPKLTQEENIKRIMAENKAAAKRLQEKMNKPEKTLGEKLKDYKGDPDGMKDGGKVKKKRKHNDNVDDEDIGEGKSKERFLRVMPQASGVPRLDGIMELATGGMTNISDTYDNNPTLQSQYPNKQDYLDLFAQQTTTTTPQTSTTTQSTTSTIAPINPIKPIIPLPQDSGDGGGGGITRAGPNRFDYGYTSLSTDKEQGESAKGGYRTPGTKANEDFLYDIGVGTIPDEDYDKIEELKDTFYGVKAGLGNFYKTVSPFLNAKKALAKGQDFALDLIQKAKDAAAARAEAKLQAQRDRLTYSGPAFTNQDGSTISQDFSTPAGLSNYDADVLR